MAGPTFSSKDNSLDLRGASVYFVGIKGSGMAALAQLYHGLGARISGADVADTFFTDALLQDLGIEYFQGFDGENVPKVCDFVVYSLAYDPATHPELVRAAQYGHRLYSYPEALGRVSAAMPSAAVAGVHGKTSTSAMVGVLVKSLGLEASVLVGSTTADFGGRACLSQGDRFFVAETCEYRRSFMHFHPRYALVTSIEADHLDYFKDYEDILQTFVEFGLKLPEGGTLVYCADDDGACELARRLQSQRSDVLYVPYGFSAHGGYRITSQTQKSGAQSFSLSGLTGSNGRPIGFTMPIPGRHMVQNGAGAIALLLSIYTDQYGTMSPSLLEGMATGLSGFSSTRRRSEIKGQVNGITIIDDYGHHPTAMASTLQGYRDFYPGRRIVVDFMSHTYSRTAALLDQFASSFSAADAVILHKIYASAREHFDGTIDGRDLYEATVKHHGDVTYIDEPLDALDHLIERLRPGDVFITMGAGDNFRLGEALLEKLRELHKEQQ